MNEIIITEKRKALKSVRVIENKFKSVPVCGNEFHAASLIIF